MLPNERISDHRTVFKAFARPGRFPSNLLSFRASQQPVSLYSTGTYSLHDFHRFVDKPNLTCPTLTLTSATALPPALAPSTPAPANKEIVGASRHLDRLSAWIS
ncbi:hypothetical protein PAXINDRAFT_19329 [Paxillus involutus ATCC 200175]|uniref:Uncharacterized protein n=1 Tax=Paxillus involutus ATCC 200175 TaxID=664439 RepID=A0A0C9SN85_PAXIN|nr:hypothetical protein PAXINDRAFT_19329 [Paxillus involutus ATCC 200175]